jgi:hypothetical protein
MADGDRLRVVELGRCRCSTDADGEAKDGRQVVRGVRGGFDRQATGDKQTAGPTAAEGS